MSPLFKPIAHFSPVLDDFIRQKYSIDFNGVNEYMLNNTEQSIGIANAWSVAYWIKPQAGCFNVHSNILDLKPADTLNDRIVSAIRGNIGSDPLRIMLYDSAGAFFKVYAWNDLFTQDVWSFVVYTWDDTDLLLYVDGTLRAPSSTTTDAGGIMVDSNRRVWGAVGFGAASPADCRLHSIGLWDKPLTDPEQVSLYNRGNGRAVDWASNRAAYVSSANLQHWWRLGNKVSPELGADSGYAGTLIDIEVDAVNITDDDREEDSPGG